MKNLSLLLLFWPLLCAGQGDSIRMAAVARKLEALTERDSTFARTVDVTAGRLPLSELLRNIARASGVNLSVRSVENVPVSCNFTRARVDELVRFLCREYTLDVETTGNILSVFPAVSVPAPHPEPEIFYKAGSRRRSVSYSPTIWPMMAAAVGRSRISEAIWPISNSPSDRSPSKIPRFERPRPSSSFSSSAVAPLLSASSTAR